MTDGTSALKGFAAPEPDQSFPPMATVASQARDSNYMVSESDGWHLGLERPRRAWAGQWRQSLAKPTTCYNATSTMDYIVRHWTSDGAITPACRALLSWRLGMLDANTPPWSCGPNQSLAVRAFARMVSRRTWSGFRTWRGQCHLGLQVV